MLTLECPFPFQCSSDAYCCSISYSAENDPHRTERNLPLDSSANFNRMAVVESVLKLGKIENHGTEVISHLHSQFCLLSNSLRPSSLDNLYVSVKRQLVFGSTP